MRSYNISVRDLIEFVLRSGDISFGEGVFLSNERALIGTRLHKKIQKKWMKSGWSVEHMLKHSVNFGDYELIVEGRADAIDTEASPAAVYEIKTTDASLTKIDESYNNLHWAQAFCYAYIYALQNNLLEMGICIVYCNIETEELKELNKKCTFEWLENYFDNIVRQYNEFLEFDNSRQIIRNQSIHNLSFPFDNYRKGQRELCVAVYKTIKNRCKLFAQAPTGIGKTISTVFPAIKALGEDLTGKIFYLTAKTTTRSLPQDAIKILQEKSLKINYTTLYAKEKICFRDKPECNPEACKYAKGHFDRINGAMLDALKNCSSFDREAIISFAEKHNVCPFEFSLDLTIWSDVVICDYNYVFDPRVYLRRFFQEEVGNYVFLVDEAHNLVDRAREMFSASLSKKAFLDFKKYTKETYPELSRTLSDINKYFIQISKNADKTILDSTYYIDKEKDMTISILLELFMLKAREFLDRHVRDDKYEEFLQLYFDAFFFLRILEIYDGNFCTYLYKDSEGAVLKLYCLDPSSQLKNAFSKGSAAVLFSATLVPMNYYFSMLGGNTEDFRITLNSPFLPDNKCVIVARDISTTYKKRDSYHEKVADYIKKVVDVRPGNYFTFFPSYKYMQDVYEIFHSKYPEVDVVMQERKYTDVEREEFINSFPDDNSDTRVGFCVLGGVFSEGIDMKNDRLIGAIIVGVGLPQVCLERELIREFYSTNEDGYYNTADAGFENAYVYPGITKVLQAAGRVIRTENDRGVILLLDERFSTQRYQELYPDDWYPVNYVSLNQIDKVLKNFW